MIQNTPMQDYVLRDEHIQKLRRDAHFRNGLSEIAPQSFLQIKCDYKVYLMSQYLTQRMCELSNRSLEVGFVYGGKTQTKTTHYDTQTIIDIQSMYITPKQNVSATHFHSMNAYFETASNSFSKQKQRIVGIGHSHGTLPVFHSKTDYDACKQLSLIEGIKVPLYSNENGLGKKKICFSSKSLREKKLFARKAPIQKKIQTKRNNTPKHAYIIPSLVFNTKNDLDLQIGYHTIDSFELKKKVSIQFYNKKCVLTIDEKKMLDRKAIEILHYNNIIPMQRHLV